MRHPQTTVLIVVIEHDKPIANVTDLVAARAYTLDGVRDTQAVVVTANKAREEILSTIRREFPR